jgi:hypothetical protein
MIFFISFFMLIFNDYSLFEVVLIILLISMIIIIELMHSLNLNLYKMIKEMIMYDNVYDQQVMNIDYLE